MSLYLAISTSTNLYLTSCIFNHSFIMSTPLVHPSPSPLPSSEQVLSPLQLTKLPPLQFSQENADYFDAAKLELKYSMQHLLQEAQATETRMQTVLETLWKRMLERMESKEKLFRIQLTKEQEELAAAKANLCRLTEVETALTSQNVRQRTELVAAEKNQHWLQDELSRVKKQLKLKEAKLSSVCEDSKSTRENYTADINALKKTAGEQSKIINEYQQKISKMTDKLQKLSRDLCLEKESSQQVQKTSSSQINQKNADNRKMAVEMSTLKVTKHNN